MVNSPTYTNSCLLAPTGSWEFVLFAYSTSQVCVWGKELIASLSLRVVNRAFCLHWLVKAKVKEQRKRKNRQIVTLASGTYLCLYLLNNVDILHENIVKYIQGAHVLFPSEEFPPLWKFAINLLSLWEIFSKRNVYSRYSLLDILRSIFLLEFSYCLVNYKAGLPNLWVASHARN